MHARVNRLELHVRPLGLEGRIMSVKIFMSVTILSTEEKISKLERELENANDLLAAARQRGMRLLKFSTLFKYVNSLLCLSGSWAAGILRCTQIERLSHGHC